MPKDHHVIYPKVEILTKDSRAILSDSVELKQHIKQSGNLGGFIIGMYNSDFELINSRSTNPMSIRCTTNATMATMRIVRSILFLIFEERKESNNLSGYRQFDGLS